MRVKTSLIPATILAATALAASAFAQGPPPAPVRVDAVRLENVQQRRQVTGNLRAVSRSRVAAREPGLVIHLPIHAGDRVNRGDVLARLDDERLAIQLQQVEAQRQVLEATLAEREAQVAIRRSDLEMMQTLEARGAVNPKEITDARLEVVAAEARRDQAQRELAVTQASADLLRKRLADTVITAPFEGVIIARLTELGQWIGEGQPVAEIVAVRAFEAWLDVPQRLAAAASAGDLEAAVQVEAVERSFPSRSVRIIRDVDPMARTFSLVLTIEDEVDVLSPGMSVTAWLPAGAMAEQLTVHKDAVLRSDAGAFVYAVRAGGPDQPGAAAPVSVQVLFDIRDRVVIRTAPGALESGDLLVIEGNERLRPMQPVRIVQAPAEKPARETAISND